MSQKRRVSHIVIIVLYLYLHLYHKLVMRPGPKKLLLARADCPNFSLKPEPQILNSVDIENLQFLTGYQICSEYSIGPTMSLTFYRADLSGDRRRLTLRSASRMSACVLWQIQRKSVNERVLSSWSTFYRQCNSLYHQFIHLFEQINSNQAAKGP